MRSKGRILFMERSSAACYEPAVVLCPGFVTGEKQGDHFASWQAACNPGAGASPLPGGYPLLLASSGSDLRYMLRYYAFCCLFLASPFRCAGQAFSYAPGQHFLHFQKNRHRQAVYTTGEVLTFELNGSKAKISDRIQGFEDSLLVFSSYKVNPQDITALYVDEKTKIWFIFRYKYEKAFFLAGALFLPLDIVNSGQVAPQAATISGALLGASLLAHWLISDKLQIKGKRKLRVIAY